MRPRRRRSSTSGLNDAYRMRLADAIELAYPRLAAALGPLAFESILAEYLASYPARLTMPGGAGERLPELLASDRYPAWYCELAMLDRAYAEVVAAAVALPCTREHLLDRGAAVRLVPAHALLEVTTSVALGAGPAYRLAAPDVVLVWRRYAGLAVGTGEVTSIVHRTVDPEEVPALFLAARGARVGDIAASLPAAANTYARAIDVMLRWIDDGIIQPI